MWTSVEYEVGASTDVRTPPDHSDVPALQATDLRLMVELVWVRKIESIKYCF